MTPTFSEAQETAILDLVREVAKAEIMARFRKLSEDQILAKSSPTDLVTEADLAAEARLTAGLQDMFPDALVIGEEAIHRTPALRDQLADAPLAFIIDPVDGTWNFARELPLFGVILCASGYGTPVWGALLDPVLDDWIVAGTGTPARQAAADLPERVLKTSDITDPGEMNGIVHLGLMPESMKPKVAATFPQFSRATALRCSCHEYRLLARGHVDFCLSSTLNPWDHAAGAAIARQAGGVARMVDGRDYDVGITAGNLLVASSEASWETVREIFGFLA